MVTGAPCAARRQPISTVGIMWLVIGDGMIIKGVFRCKKI
jgi:hypothetical protein